MTSTNIHWLMGVSVLVMLAMPTDWLGAHERWVVSWALICGLSGPPGVIALAGFPARYAFNRVRVHLLVSAVMLVCALIQLVVISQAGVVNARSAPTSISILTLPILLQSVVVPIFSIGFADAIGAAINTNPNRVSPTVIGLLVLGVGLISIILRAAFRK